MIKLAINGFGRIGRVAFRAALNYPDKVKIVAINTSGSIGAAGWAHLLKYDSVYGQFKQEVSFKEEKGQKKLGELVVNGQRIPVFGIREPKEIPWKEFDVDVVLEATGVFRDRSLAKAHLDAGAKKVIVTATAKNTEPIVMGVNEKNYKGGLIVSNASCTTNCIAPVVKILKENFGIEKALMSTVHSVTSDQNLVDNSHKDLRRARAAANNIIPTTTGAAKATSQVVDGLEGLFDGIAYRVPTICGSIAEVTALTTKRTTVEEVNRAFEKASKGNYKGILSVEKDPLVSTDILSSPFSSIVDLELTRVIDGDLVKVVSWYDNEWGYSCRLIELAILIATE